MLCPIYILLLSLLLASFYIIFAPSLISSLVYNSSYNASSLAIATALFAALLASLYAQCCSSLWCLVGLFCPSFFFLQFPPSDLFINFLVSPSSMFSLYNPLLEFDVALCWYYLAVFCCFQVRSLKPGTHHAIFVVCWTQRRRKDDCCMVCAHQRQLSPVDFTNATVVGPIRKTNRSNNCCMVCAGQRHLSHQPTGHRPITVKYFRDA